MRAPPTSLVWRLLARDWRAGELTLLTAALVIAVGAVTAISLFVGKLGAALVGESATVLAADRIVASSQPLPEKFRSAADAHGIAHADIMTFPSMIFAGERNQLVSVKAVSAGYPLRGVVKTAMEPFVAGQGADGIPARGEVWLDGRLFPALDVRLGSSVSVGDATLVVSRVLVDEPDRGAAFFDLGPRLLMNIDDVPATRVIQPGSRISYRLLLRGEESQLEELQRDLEPQLGPNARWRGVRDSSRSVGSALDRAESFLLLGGLLAVLLAGIAVALAANRYAERHYDHVAILKTLGATPNQVTAGYLLALAVIGVTGVALGLVAGAAVQIGIVQVLSAYLPELPDAGWRPFVTGAITGFVCLLAFALPPIFALRHVAPLRVMRRDLAGPVRLRVVAYAAAAAGMLGLLAWYTQSWWLTAWTLAAVTGVVVVFGALAMLLLSTGRVIGMQAGSGWRLAVAALRRRHRTNVGQMLMFGLAIMIALLLVLLRTDLIDEWRRQVPTDAPNHFVMNVTPDQLDAVAAWLSAHARYEGRLYPMIRGRIVAVNGVDAKTWQEQHAGDEEPRSVGVRSERNLSFSADLPPNNRVVEGEWWAPTTDELLISVEKDYAAETALSLGDEVDFDIAGLPARAKVASIRTLDWDSLQPNFFILFSPPALREFPATYMTSFRLDPADKRALNDLLAKFPTLTVIEIDQIIAEVQSVIARVTRAVELVLALTLVAGCLVLMSSIQASRDERLQEHALLRALGGPSRLIRGALAAEFALLGAFAGVIATVGAEVTAAVLAKEVFDLDARIHPWLWLAGPAIGALVVATVGLAGTGRLVKASPITVLREVG